MSRGIKRAEDEIGKRMKGKERKGGSLQGENTQKGATFYPAHTNIKSGTGLYHNENTLRWKEMTETIYSQIHSGKAERSNIKRHEEQAQL